MSPIRYALTQFATLVASDHSGPRRMYQSNPEEQDSALTALKTVNDAAEQYIQNPNEELVENAGKAYIKFLFDRILLVEAAIEVS